MTTAREEVLCPCPDCNHSYRRRETLLPVVREGETYSYVRKDCQHLIAHPDDNPEWGKDLLAAFLKDYNNEFAKLGINVEKLDREELERQRDRLESIIRKRIEEVDGFFFRCNDADIDDAILELRPILIGLQTAGS